MESKEEQVLATKAFEQGRDDALHGRPAVARLGSDQASYHAGYDAGRARARMRPRSRGTSRGLR